MVRMMDFPRDLLGVREGLGNVEATLREGGREGRREGGRKSAKRDSHFGGRNKSR